MAILTVSPSRPASCWQTGRLSRTTSSPRPTAPASRTMPIPSRNLPRAESWATSSRRPSAASSREAVDLCTPSSAAISVTPASPSLARISRMAAARSTDWMGPASCRPGTVSGGPTGLLLSMVQHYRPASIVRVRHDRGRRRLSHVALVLGRGRSQEEVKLGEALGLAYLDAALRKSRPDVGVCLINSIIDPELRGCRDDDLTDAIVAARRVAATAPVLCGVSLVYRGQRDWTATFAAALKQLAPSCHIVLGGMWPTSAWELLLGSIPQADSVCIG